jgi:all-trans-8'-apo-beta-carotenal 15,15'-oxygenase
VEGAVRIVQTRGLLRERAAGKKLFGGYNTPMVRPLREVFRGDSKNPANTGILASDGRVFALCEGGRPYELRPEDLTTVDEVDFDGAVARTFNPHPHRVAARKTTYSIGLRRGKATILDLYALADDSRAVHNVGSLQVPGLMMAHDFAVTERHIIVMVPPMRLRVLPLLMRRKGFVDCLEWQYEHGTELLVIPIEDPAHPIKITVEGCLIEHFANAWERGGELVFDGITYPDMGTLDRFVMSLGRGTARGSFNNSLTRFVLDLRAKSACTEVILREPIELPQVAPAVFATENRYVYVVGYRSPRASGSGLWDSVIKLDVRSGAVERFTPGAGQHPSEPLFVPRDGATAEDDGYILTQVLDATTGQSREVVLDARRLSDGPIASAYFPGVVPVRIHGAFAPA